MAAKIWNCSVSWDVWIGMLLLRFSRTWPGPAGMSRSSLIAEKACHN